MTTPYDRVLYPGTAHAETHPDHLGALAGLFGLDPAPPAGARVLELGCGQGRNLVPMAEQLPGARVEGLDLSARAVAEAQRLAEGLPNVRLRCADLADPPGDLGEFDYIVCHGVYSWVPPEAQAGILRLVREHLAPHGVALLSHNALPGWSGRGAVRELMRFHAAGFEDPGEQVEQARAALRFVRRALEGHSGPWPELVRELDDFLAGRPDWYIYHEYLTPHNEALSLVELVRRVEAAGLQVVTDADFPSTCPDRWPDEVAAQVRALGQTWVDTEQYMDFIRDRRFRRSVLCQGERALERSLDPTRLRGRRVRMRVVVHTLSPQRDQSAAVFHVGDTPVTTHEPVIKAALVALGQAWPEPIGFAELLDAARATARSPSPRAQDERDLGGTLLTCVWQGLAELRWEPGRWATRAPARPQLGVVNRRLAAWGGELVSLDHVNFGLRQPLNRLLAQWMDGAHSVEALAERALHAAQSGAVELPCLEDEALEDAALRAVQELTQTFLERRLLVG